MANPWKKSSPDLIERFTAALPAQPDLVRKPMFGYPAAFVNGNMACGLFQESVVVRLGKEEAPRVVASGATLPFAPMPGRTMSGYVIVPDADAQDAAALSAWLGRAVNYALTLPKKSAAKPARKKPLAKE